MGILTEDEKVEISYKEGFKDQQEVISIFKDIMEIQGDCDHYDHHGYCQTHNLHDKEDCPMYRIRNLMNKWGV